MIEKLARNYEEDGFLLTVGKAFKYFGNKIENVSDWLNQVLEEDSLPLYHRLRAIYYECDLEMYVWLNLQNKNPNDYFSNHKTSGSRLTRELNVHSEIIDNDLVFNLVTGRYREEVPEIHGMVHEGGVYAESAGTERIDVIDLLDENGRLFLKPPSGSEGEDLYSFTKNEDGIYVNGNPITERDLEQLIHQLDDYIVQEFVDQHEYAERIYPRTTNTVRIITGYDSVRNEPYIFSATHRFGSEESKPADNRSQGGYAAPVNLETGELRPLVRVDDSGERKVYANHPETHERVQGQELPYWNEVCELVKDVSRIHRHLSIVGWDVVITPDGPIIIEGNSAPRSILGQLEKGYFEDERMSRILQKNSDDK